jgi:hypothetical protein
MSPILGYVTYTAEDMTVEFYYTTDKGNTHLKL